MSSFLQIPTGKVIVINLYTFVYLESLLIYLCHLILQDNLTGIPPVTWRRASSFSDTHVIPDPSRMCLS